MMMPVVDQGPSVAAAAHHHHHHHGHGHQTFYQPVPSSEGTNKMQLTLILPNGVPSVINVDTNTPMMDLLVQAASNNKLNPSSYSLVVLDSNQHIIHFKPNQTVGQIVQNCQLPQLNGSSTISLLPKEATHPTTTSSCKSKSQPFEITVRLQVNLPDAQKILLRVDPTLPLYEIKEQICKQKKYVDSSRFSLALPHKPHQPLLLGLSLAEYKTNELTLIHLKKDPRLTSNQIQSFDRLYRVRSESQPPKESSEERTTTQQETTSVKQRPASVQLSSSRSPARDTTVTSLPPRAAQPPITSHTSLHAYWNDPNFDTQSQTSACSSSSKKRRAPRAPGQLSPIDLPRLPPDHHDSQESLTDNTNGTKQKRKAPVPPLANVTQENSTSSDGQVTTIEQTVVHSTAEQHDQQPTMTSTTEQQIHEEIQHITNTNESTEEQVNPPSTPIYSQIDKTKDLTQIESPYSTLKSTPSPPPITMTSEENRPNSPTNYTVEEIVQAGIAEPPVRSVTTEKPTKTTTKPSKKSVSVDGLVKIVQDHQERAQIYQESEKPAEEVSYFRVAKSRCGKFETDNRGFVSQVSDVFVETEKNEPMATKSNTVKTTEVTVRPVQTSKPVVNQQQQPPSKGKQAYNLLKKYEKEEEEAAAATNSTMVDTEYLKNPPTTVVAEKEKSPTPIQLEVTERTTHISVTVESDRKQLFTRASPIPQSQSSSPTPTGPSSTILAPKPFGKTITEYRTVRRIGNDGETTTTTTVRTETIPSPKPDESRGSSVEKEQPASHENLMESIRQFGGAENLQKK